MDFGGEVAGEVFVDDADAVKKARMREFVVAEIIPVFEVACKVDLFGGQEGSLSFLVHLPYLESERGGG